MSVLIYLHVAIASRLRELNAPGERDRGDSPVPTAIIIAGLAALAAVVLVWAGTLAQNWMADPPAKP